MNTQIILKLCIFERIIKHYYIKKPFTTQFHMNTGISSAHGTTFSMFAFLKPHHALQFFTSVAKSSEQTISSIAYKL